MTGKYNAPAKGQKTIIDIPETVKGRERVFIGALRELESAAQGLSHGIVRLEVHIRDGNPARFVVNREQSFLVGGAV